MLVKTPKIVALLKVMASLRDWHSHNEIDDTLSERSREAVNDGDEFQYDACHQWGAPTLERLKRLRIEGLVKSEIRHDIPIQAVVSHICCNQWWRMDARCEHETKWWTTEYTKHVSLTYWVITPQGKKLAPDVVANATRNFGPSAYGERS